MPSAESMYSPLLYMKLGWQGKFSIMDFYLQACQDTRIGGYLSEHLHLIDIGKPETLVQAESFLAKL
jgi:MurNAc alpha-1-phosphate uridylyltransferase